MGDLSFFQSRCVVFKRNMVSGVVHVEVAQPVCICKLSEFVKLISRERGLKLIGGFYQGHRCDYNRARGISRGSMEYNRHEVLII